MTEADIIVPRNRHVASMHSLSEITSEMIGRTPCRRNASAATVSAPRQLAILHNMHTANMCSYISERELMFTFAIYRCPSVRLSVSL